MSKEQKIVIKPSSGWQLINLKEIREYKDLLYTMVLRDITVQYKQTIMGFAWAVLNPLLMMLVFNIIFGIFVKVPTGATNIPYPIFSFAALVPWTYFAQSLTVSTSSLVVASQMLSKVYFPRLFLPLTPIFAKLSDFLIAFVMLLIMMVYYHTSPTINVIYLPLLIIIMVMTSAGLGMWLSAMAIQFRDIRFAITFIVQMLMYIAPVVWSGTKIPHQYRLIYGLYPMAGVIEGFRSALLGNGPMPWDFIGMGSITAVFLFLSGAFYFRRTEKVFADVA